MNTFNLRLDLDKAPTLPLWVTIRQGDMNGTTISASIYDHGTLLTGSYNARIAFRLPDGEHYYRKDATFSSGVATVTIDETEAASVTGNTVGYFEILSGSTVIASTASFGIHVLQSATENMTPGENYDTAIQDAIDGLNEAVAELPDTVEDILEDHPEWTTTVQDGSISVPKLASDVRSSLSGAILAAIGGTLVTTHDAAAVPPYALALFGRSTQGGTPTPSSPVAITSVTAADVYVSGRNMVNMAETLPYTRTNSGVTFTVNADQTITINGTATANSWSHAAAYMPSVLLPAGSYTTRCELADGTISNALMVRVVRKSDSAGISYAGNVATFVLAEPTEVLVCAVVGNGYVASNATIRVMLEAGTTATPYTPYVGSTLHIDLQGHELRSLPDGTRDEVQVGADGHATLVQRVGSVDMGTMEWYRDDSGFFYSDSLADKAVGHHNIMSTAYATTSATTVSGMVSGEIKGHVSQARVFLKNSAYTTASALKASLNGVTLNYALATPTTIDLGYVTLPTLPAPDLTAWAAQGAELAVTYQRDATLVVAGIYAQLAPVDGPTATSNHAAGTYLMLGGTLCKVTTAIAVGEQITIGTNVVATTVMTEILALTA